MAARTLSLPLSLRRRPSEAGVPAGTTRRALRPRPRVVVALVLIVAAVAGGWWWVRDSPLVAVDEVRITGLRSPQASAIRAALTGAAQDMTTLNVREDALRAAASRFPIVADVRATGDPPGLLRIEVVEHVPVAALVAGGRSIPVAADGTLLRGVVARGVPAITVKAPPVGERVSDPLALAQVRILAAAPAVLRDRVTRMFTGARGMQAQFSEGPVVAFGAPDRLAAKWMAITAVLAEPSSAGATLIDVTVPESPAAVGLAPLPEPDASADPTSPASTAGDAAAATARTTPVTPPAIAAPQAPQTP